MKDFQGQDKFIDGNTFHRLSAEVSGLRAVAESTRTNGEKPIRGSVGLLQPSSSHTDEPGNDRECESYWVGRRPPGMPAMAPTNEVEQRDDGRFAQWNSTKPRVAVEFGNANGIETTSPRFAAKRNREQPDQATARQWCSTKFTKGGTNCH